MRIILASKSPRRKELLNVIGIEPEIFHPSIHEIMVDGEALEKFLERITESKVEAIYREDHGDSLLIGCDTVVVCNNRMMGKPRSRDEAFGFLKELSGQPHEVLSGLFLRYKRERRFQIERTTVHFSRMTDDEINEYLDHGEYKDKAGAYGIQGHASIYIPRIEGCYFNVVGFPLPLFYTMTKTMGIPLYGKFPPII
jgi:septum formation protein